MVRLVVLSSQLQPRRSAIVSIHLLGSTQQSYPDCGKSTAAPRAHHEEVAEYRAPLCHHHHRCQRIEMATENQCAPLWRQSCVLMMDGCHRAVETVADAMAMAIETAIAIETAASMVTKATVLFLCGGERCGTCDPTSAGKALHDPKSTGGEGGAYDESGEARGEINRRDGGAQVAHSFRSSCEPLRP